MVNAEHHKTYFAEQHPDMIFEIFDLHAADCPVLIDWEWYADGNEPSSKTMSGVKDKFRSRNARFKVRCLKLGTPYCDTCPERFACYTKRGTW